jgi:hypothetical protein
MDKRGTFFGTLVFNNKDFSAMLVEKGFAKCFVFGNAVPSNMETLEELEI